MNRLYKIKHRIVLCLVIFGLGTLPAFAQKKEGKKLCELIVAMEKLVHFDTILVASDTSIFMKYFQTKDTIKKYPDIDSDSLLLLIKRAESITICHLWRPDVYHALANIRQAISGLEIALFVKRAFISSIPSYSNLHISDRTDTIYNRKKYSWNKYLDPWVNSVYYYNMKPIFLNTAILPVILEYERFKYALGELKKELPRKWQKKYGGA